jgi:hypothetical protein
MTSKEKSIKVSTILEIIAKLRKKYSNFEKVYKPSLISENYNYQYITSSNDVFIL